MNPVRSCGAALTRLIFFLFGIENATPAPAVLDVSPRSGPAGTVVSVAGTGFGSSAAAVTAKVGGTAATIVNVAPELIRIQAPAASGAVDITVSGESSSSLLPFVSTRTVTGTFVPPAGMNADGYYTGLLTAASTGTSFSIPAGNDAVEPVWAWRGENDSMFGALVFPDSATVQIDAASTALVLVAISPLAPKSDPAAVNAVLAKINGTAELAALTSLIQQAGGGGYPYVEDGRFPAAYEALLTKAFKPSPPGLATPRDFVHPGSSKVHQLTPEHGVAPLRLQYTLPAPGTNPTQTLTVSPATANPTRLHQNVEVWRVNPSWFTDGFAHIDRLSITDRPTLLDPAPIASGYVAAKLGSANLDIAGALLSAIPAMIFGEEAAPGIAKFELSRARPGIYMINSYSGNVWYGSQSADPGASQATLLGQIDVNDKWTEALVANLMTSAIDFVSIILPDFRVLGSRDVSRTIKNAAGKVTKTVIASRSATGGITAGAVAEIGRTVAIGLLKASKEILGGDDSPAASGFFAGAKRLLKGVFEGARKVSAGLQIVERGMSLITPTHFAVERTVVVIGDPFAPRITSFFPLSGRGGDLITLSGETLPFNTSGYTVNFIAFETTGAPPKPEKRLPATIVSSNLGAWLIKAPTAAQWESTFGPGNKQVFLGITSTATGGEATTQENAAPNSLFSYRAPPQITGVNPASALPGTMLSVEGPGFDPSNDMGINIEVDGSVAGSALSVSPTRVQFQLSGSIANGSHTMRLLFHDRSLQITGTSNTINFTVSNPYPPLAGNNISRRLRVMNRNFTNVPDGQISLFEALALAGGTLGRSLTVRPEGQSEGSFESDWVQFPSGPTGSYGSGASIRDTVVVENSATGSTTITLTAPLPPPGNGDTLSLGSLVFNGEGTPADTIGWDLRGVSGNQLEGDVVFRSFPGHGIVLGAGSQGNRILGATLSFCDGDGVLFMDGASDNFFHALVVSESGGAGVRLSGPGVARNELASDKSVPLSGIFEVMVVENSLQEGIVIEGGAHNNIIDVWDVRGNEGDGVRITGTGTDSNLIGGAHLPVTRDVALNKGNGVSILDGASDNVILNVSASGNRGDGFRLEGVTTTRNNLRSIVTGFDFSSELTPAFISRNEGNGVHIIDSSWNLIGTGTRGALINTPFSALGGSENPSATVLISGIGAHHNMIDSTNLGFIDPITAPLNTPPALLINPASTHAIHLTDGAHDNVIGHDNRDAAVTILGTPNGDGVRIEGFGTDRNRVLGTTFGLLRGDSPVEPQRLLNGVHILDGAARNRIGEPGEQRAPSFPVPGSQPYNAYAAITGAGILLENLDALLYTAGEPTDANQLINNRMGFASSGGAPPLHPEVGIHLKGVTGQRIGGQSRGEGNQVSRYGFAGLWIEGHVPDYEHRNRITGNATLIGVGTTAANPNTDPFAGPMAAQGLLITGGSGQVVGEEFPLYNQFNGSRVAGYVDGGIGHWIRASTFDSGLRGGLVIHNGANHRVGGKRNADRVEITRGGTVGDDNTAGLILAGPGGHRIEGCWIGDFGTVDTIWGSRSHGILIHESAGNYIGGTLEVEGNLIVRSGGDGIVVRGAASTGNQIGSNRIGIGTIFSPNPGNTGAGIRLTGGAHDNLIGGEQVPAGMPANSPAFLAKNIIRGNGGDGVLVSGNTTTGNRILQNSINANNGLGIRLAGGGNHLQPPPAVVYYADGMVTGSVASLTPTPAGSRIEAFANPDGPSPEGETFLEFGIVKVDGTFAFPVAPPVAPFKITVTATHGSTGDTSEFVVATDPPPDPPREVFGFALSVPLGESTLTRPWPASAFSAVVLTASTNNATVALTDLHVHAAGTGGFAAALAGVSLFEDVDRDGVWSAPDRALADVTPFDAGTRTAILQVQDALVSDGEARRWVLRLHPAPGASPSGTVRLEILNPGAVGEFYWEPYGATGVSAIFPLQSALFDASVVDPRAAWRTSFGLPADGSGNGADNADPDRDGLVNLLEYALGSSPVNEKDAARPVASRATGPDRITFSYQKLRTEITYSVEASSTLSGPWSATGVNQGAGPSVSASIPVSGSRQFLRLRVSAP